MSKRQWMIGLILMFGMGWFLGWLTPPGKPAKQSKAVASATASVRRLPATQRKPQGRPLATSRPQKPKAATAVGNSLTPTQRQEVHLLMLRFKALVDEPMQDRYKAGGRLTHYERHLHIVVGPGFRQEPAGTFYGVSDTIIRSRALLDVQVCQRLLGDNIPEHRHSSPNVPE